MQSGGYACGLFAVAFVKALVHGEQPRRFLFDQNKMRPKVSAGGRDDAIPIKEDSA